MAAPARIKNERIQLVRDAGRLTGWKRRKLWTLVSSGVLTNATPPADRGRGRVCFVWADEVEVLRTQGEVACREYRCQKGRA